MTVALAQFAAGEDKQANLEVIRSYAQQAAQAGASMLFLPEYSMFYAKMNRQSRNVQAAEPLTGAFMQALAQIARTHGLWLAAGL